MLEFDENNTIRKKKFELFKIRQAQKEQERQVRKDQSPSPVNMIKPKVKNLKGRD